MRDNYTDLLIEGVELRKEVLVLRTWAESGEWFDPDDEMADASGMVQADQISALDRFTSNNMTEDYRQLVFWKEQRTVLHAFSRKPKELVIQDETGRHVVIEHV